MAGGLVAVVAIVLLTLAYPLFGLGLALVLGPFGALESIVWGGSFLDTGQLALMLTFAAWIGAGLARRRLSIHATAFNLPWLLFVAIAALSLLDSYAIAPGLVELIKWMEVALLVWLILDFAGRDGADRPKLTRIILAILLFAGLVQACIGIWQFSLRGTGPEHFTVLGRFYRAYGTFEQPNPFGGYMNLTAMLALGTLWGLLVAVFRKRGRPGESAVWRPFWRWLAFALLCAGAASLSVVLSWSRGAWLGFLAGAAVLALFSTRRVWLGLLLMLGAVTALSLFLFFASAAGFGPAQAVVARLGGFRSEFTLGDVRGVPVNDENYSVLERLAHWQAATNMARDDLWTGVGFGNYEAAYPEYALVKFPAALGHAHNYYLNLLAEIGVPGLLAYLFFWAVVAGQSIWLIQRLEWPERGVAVGLLAAWTTLAVHQLVDKLFVNNIYVHLGVMLGLLQLLAWSGFWVKQARCRRPNDSGA